jgi:hypothetical protein
MGLYFFFQRQLVAVPQTGPRRIGLFVVVAAISMTCVIAVAKFKAIRLELCKVCDEFESRRATPLDWAIEGIGFASMACERVECAACHWRWVLGTPMRPGGRWFGSDVFLYR